MVVEPYKNVVNPEFVVKRSKRQIGDEIQIEYSMKGDVEWISWAFKKYLTKSKNKHFLLYWNKTSDIENGFIVEKVPILVFSSVSLLKAQRFHGPDYHTLDIILRGNPERDTFKRLDAYFFNTYKNTTYKK